MTQREQKIILSAIDEIMNDDGDFAKGINSLLELCDKEYPAYKIRKHLKRVSIAELACRGNSKFSIGKI